MIYTSRARKHIKQSRVVSREQLGALAASLNLTVPAAQWCSGMMYLQQHLQMENLTLNTKNGQSAQHSYLQMDYEEIREELPMETTQGESIGIAESTIVSSITLDETEDEFDDTVVTADDCLDFVDVVEEKKPEPQTARELLLSMLGNREGLKNALKLMDANEKGKAKLKHTAKQYRYCTVITTCSHCGVTTERTVTLETKTERFVYIGENDVVHIVSFEMIETPCTFIAKTTFCESCNDYIKYMDRAELEFKYTQLLKRLPDKA